MRSTLVSGLLIAVLASGLAPAAPAQGTGAPRIKFDSLKHDFGRVDEGAKVRFSVNASDDGESEGPHVGTITHSAAGGAYEGITIHDVVANITDNENYCGEPGQVYLDADIGGPHGVGNCNHDCFVDLYDLAYMASQWLE